MKTWCTVIAVLVMLAGCVDREPARSITAERIHADIAFLSDDRFAGRACRSPQAHEVAKHLAERFKAAGLEPLAGGDGYCHSVADAQMAPNVVGMRRGNGDELVLITAHYDHLPPAKEGDDRIYNGADDNASGVAGVLVIADALNRARTKSEASIIFVAFTGEEEGLRGSRYLAGKPPFSLSKVRGMFNMDMISRGEEDLIFVDGGRNADELRRLLREANERQNIGLRIRFDEHPDWLDRSDQGPFIRRKVPAVLFSVEDHPDYHAVTDEADRVEPQLAQRVSKLVLHAALRLAE